MSRYIDADALIRFYEPYADMGVPVNALLEQIKDTSTADVVEVVRCKNCKYAELHKDNDVIFCEINELSGRWIKADDYCSYGERKEQEHESSNQ